ncbi:beta-ketoacyl-ACP synthase II [Chloroflexota bacterium]
MTSRAELPKRKIVITGMGAITPLGNSVDELWQGLIAGKNGIGPITQFDASSFPVKLAAEVRNFEPGDYMPLKRADRCGRCAQFAIAASRMALESADLKISPEQADRVGVIIGTNGMPNSLSRQEEVLNKRGPMRVDPLMISKYGASMVAGHIGLELGAKGPNTSLNSACTSGSDAIGNALNFLRLGYADVMITGGAATNVTTLGLAGAARMGALSREPDPEKACRPFDLNRDGFTYGEGAGILILESLGHALERNAPVLAELAGAGWSFDAFNETAPDPQQQAKAMQAAIRDAGITADDIDYVNAHGTSTKLNDTAETEAIKIVCGERAYKIPVSSNKSMTGHLACAAGAVEAVAGVMTIWNEIIPPTIHYETPDPDCDLDYVPNKARHQAVDVCLSNSFGLGGQNCSLIIRRQGE